MFIIKLAAAEEEKSFKYLYEVSDYCKIEVPSLYNQIYAKAKLSKKIEYLKVNGIEVDRIKKYIKPIAPIKL